MKQTNILAVKTFRNTIINLVTFNNRSTGDDAPGLHIENHVLTETAYMRWREQNPFAVNLLLLFPLKVLITLQIRAGYLTNLISVNATNITAIAGLPDYPSITLDTGAITFYDAIFASESGRVHRILPVEAGHFLESIYKGRIQLIDRQLRANAFFTELSSHIETNLLQAMRNEWEFYEVPELDVCKFIDDEIKLIERTFRDANIRNKLLMQAAPVERMCHIWTNKAQKNTVKHDFTGFRRFSEPKKT